MLIGFSIAAPVGPIGVLCIQRTLTYGRLTGFISGLGAATADALYGCIAGFGLAFISTLLISHQSWVRLIGGIFLCFLGIKTFLALPASSNGASESKKGLLSSYASTVFLTLTNPTTILSFVAIFAGLGIGVGSGTYLQASIFVLGVFLGSASWWLILSNGAHLLRSRLSSNSLRIINRISGLIIGGFGLVALTSFIF